MYGENDVDCEKCHYGASGGQTVVCCYYGENECDPFGQCSQFEPKEDEENVEYSREDDPAFQDSLHCSADFYEADE